MKPSVVAQDPDGLSGSPGCPYPLSPWPGTREGQTALAYARDGWLSPVPLGPAAQYDCQQLAAVQVSLRLADLHCSLSRRLMVAAALKLGPFGVLTLGGLSWGSSRQQRP